VACVRISCLALELKGKDLQNSKLHLIPIGRGFSEPPWICRLARPINRTFKNDLSPPHVCRLAEAVSSTSTRHPWAAASCHRHPLVPVPVECKSQGKGEGSSGSLRLLARFLSPLQEFISCLLFLSPERRGMRSGDFDVTCPDEWQDTVLRSGFC
jgi:hypothetical protein